MRSVLDILVNGLAVGSMYAIGTVALSMIWGSLGILNPAHGAILTLGAYASYYAVIFFGFPWWMGLVAAVVMGILCGAALYGGIIHWLFDRPNAGINTIIATVAAGALIENAVTIWFSAEARPQPFSFQETLRLGGFSFRAQPVAVFATAILVTFAMTYLLKYTRLGYNIRAVSQQKVAAALQGVNVRLVYLQIMILSGVLSAISGVMLTGMTTIYPTVGAQPTIKALIICTLAGLGSQWTAVGVAIAFGILEVAAQYHLGSSFGFPIVLLIAFLLLIRFPYGLVGTAQQGRM